MRNGHQIRCSRQSSLWEHSYSHWDGFSSLFMKWLPRLKWVLISSHTTWKANIFLRTDPKMLPQQPPSHCMESQHHSIIWFTKLIEAQPRMPHLIKKSKVCSGSWQNNPPNSPFNFLVFLRRTKDTLFLEEYTDKWEAVFCTKRTGKTFEWSRNYISVQVCNQFLKLHLKLPLCLNNKAIYSLRE